MIGVQVGDVRIGQDAIIGQEGIQAGNMPTIPPAQSARTDAAAQNLQHIPSKQAGRGNALHTGVSTARQHAQLPPEQLQATSNAEGVSPAIMDSVETPVRAFSYVRIDDPQSRDGLNNSHLLNSMCCYLVSIPDSVKKSVMAVLLDTAHACPYVTTSCCFCCHHSK